MLETRRLWLRRLRPSDEPDLVALDSDAEVMRYVGNPPGVRAHAETVHRARRRIGEDHGLYGSWIIQDKANGAFHGLGFLLPLPDGDDVEVGYRLARRSWGRGIATEAVSALVRYGFDSLALPRVVAIVYPENRASRRVLEKLGFVDVGPAEYRGARVERFRLGADAWRAGRPYRANE